MAYCKKCDICGATFDYNCLKIDHVRFGEMDIGYGKKPSYFGREAYDCCPDCISAIKNVMKERKAKKK